MTQPLFFFAPKLAENPNLHFESGLHHLDETEHFIRALVGITFLIIRHIVFGTEILTPELVNLKSALVYVEMNIAFFKIRRAGFPNQRFGMKSLDRQPSAVADALGMLLGRNE